MSNDDPESSPSSPPPPSPPGHSAERLISRLTGALAGFRTAIEIVGSKTDELSERLRGIDQRLEALSRSQRSAESLSAEKLDRIIEAQRDIRDDLRESRLRLTDQHEQLTESAHELSKLRYELTPPEGTRRFTRAELAAPVPEPPEEETGVTTRGIFFTWGSIGRGVTKGVRVVAPHVLRWVGAGIGAGVGFGALARLFAWAKHLFGVG